MAEIWITFSFLFAVKRPKAVKALLRSWWYIGEREAYWRGGFKNTGSLLKLLRFVYLQDESK